MSLFSKIMSAILGKANASQPGQAGNNNATPSTASPSIAPQSSTAAPAGGAPMANVDVAATLDALAKQKKEKLDWKHSIVDLMKLLDLDSSLAARKELAKELNYSGDTSDSAAMNIWLHKQVISKLAANGGKVPADLMA